MERVEYPTDLTEDQMNLLETFLPTPSNKGRPMDWPYYEIICAILYIVRSGCAWRLLPHDFPPWQTVYYHFNKWKKTGVWKNIHDALVSFVRVQEGRNAEPSAGIIDSQSVKTTETPGERGYDAGKKVNGRKRHILVDTIGLIIAVIVHPANIQDRDGAKLLLGPLAGILPNLQLI